MLQFRKITSQPVKNIFIRFLESIKVKALVNRPLNCIDFEWSRMKCLNCMIISIRFPFARLAYLLNDLKSSVMSLVKEISMTQMPMETIQWTKHWQSKCTPQKSLLNNWQDFAHQMAALKRKISWNFLERTGNFCLAHQIGNGSTNASLPTSVK